MNLKKRKHFTTVKGIINEFKEKETFDSQQRREFPDEFVCFFLPISLYELGQILFWLSATAIAAV